jgi:hypothetical protein
MNILDRLRARLPRTCVLGSMRFNWDYTRARRRRTAAGVAPRVADDQAFREMMHRWPCAREPE